MARPLPALLALGLGAAAAFPAHAQVVDFYGGTAPLRFNGGDTMVRPTAQPDGIPIGPFTLYPAIAVGTTFTSGNFGFNGGTIVISPELVIVTNTAGKAQLRMRLGATVLPSGTTASGILSSVNASADFGYDLSPSWHVDANAHFSIAPQAFDVPDNADQTPRVRTSGAQVGIGGTVGRMQLRLSTGVEHNAYQTAMVEGVPVDQSDHNNTVLNATLRLSGGGNGHLSPYVEMEVGRRFYESDVDADGFQQDSTYAEARIGVHYDASPVLTSDFAVGYHLEFPDDPALRRLAGWSIDADTTWSPRDRVRLTASTHTVFNPDPTTESGGSIRQDWSLRGTLQMRDDLMLGVTANYGAEHFVDSIKHNASIGIDATWAPRQWLSISAGVTQQWYWSPDPLATGSQTVYSISARFAR